MEYKLIDKSIWKTGLCHCHCESCFLSCVVPCHVYSKIMSSSNIEYITRIIMYIVLYVSIQQLMYIQYNINISQCPSLEIENCIMADICEDYYMVINDLTTKCRIIDGFCVYDQYNCIEQIEYMNITKMVFLLTSLFYSILTYLHYKARYFIKTQKNIQSSICEDVCAITCSTCGLAQEYRELP